MIIPSKDEKLELDVDRAAPTEGRLGSTLDLGSNDRAGVTRMSTEIIALRDVHKSFAGVHALRGVSLTLQEGEVHSLVGENGSGKSTLIKMIAGVHAPDRGQLLVHGREYPKYSPIQAIRDGIHVIYQDFSLFPNLSVAENIVLTRSIATGARLVNWRQVSQLARRVVEKVGIDIDLMAPVEELPVAQKQLIAICRAVVDDAKLIIMDEPTTALTEREIRSLFAVVDGLKAKGISMLFVSHKLNEVLEIADNVTIIRNGEIVAAGPVSEFDRESLVRHMTGRTVDETTYQGPKAVTGEPALKVAGLSRRGKFEDVSFELRGGEVVGLAGVLGSGRTDLALALFGLRPADEGQIEIDGRARPHLERAGGDRQPHRVRT